MQGILRVTAAGPAVRLAGRGLIQAACGPDPAPSWPRWRRRAASALAALGAAMTALAILGVVLAVRHPPPAGPAAFGLRQPRFFLDTAAELAPLLLAARFPLLAWRIAYLTVLLLPLVPGQSRVDPPRWWCC